MSLFRRLLRKGIHAVQEGDKSVDIKNDPPRKPDGTIPGFQFDTVLRVPPVPGRDDEELMAEVSAQVTDAVCEPDYLLNPNRDRLIEERHFGIQAQYNGSPAAKASAGSAYVVVMGSSSVNSLWPQLERVVSTCPRRLVQVECEYIAGFPAKPVAGGA